MINAEYARNIQKARDLYLQGLANGIDYGCFQISLVALGADLSFSDMDRTQRAPRPLADAIERTGLNINWLVCPDGAISPEGIDRLLTGKIAVEENFPDGTVAGFLWIAFFPNEPNHVIAILPTKEGPFTVIDAACGGQIEMPAEKLANYAKHISSQGGRFEIVQLKC